MPTAGAGSALLHFYETEARQTWKGQPDPPTAQRAGTRDAEPDAVNPIDSRALLQPGTTGAGNALYFKNGR